MDSIENASIEKEYQNLSFDELQLKRSGIRSKILHLQNEISNLAFNNYRTYAAVGRTAEHCKEMFTEMNKCMSKVKTDFPSLIENMETYQSTSRKIQEEYDVIDGVDSANCLVWELLKLPNIMEKCIRAGKYESAYAITNFAVNLKQSALVQNPMIKNVIEILIEARHSLLDELFNKFSGPIDLAKSIQITNNIRKIPYISNTQLRVSILQYRDVYLEKNVLGIISEPEFVFRVIDVYRDTMYDTIILYLAVFPDTDFQRKYYSTDDDSRWQRWNEGLQTFLLQAWAHRNIERLFEFIRNSENITSLNIEAMIGKLMSFAFSFGRLGLDFRSLVINEFTKIVVDIFSKKLNLATKNLENINRLVLIDSDTFESTKNDLDDGINLAVLTAPIELCIWDDLCVFGNQIIEALNEIRDLLSINLLNSIYDTIKISLQSLFKCLDGFVSKADSKNSAEQAAKLTLTYFIPFINKCFFNCFPYEKCCKPYFNASITFESYTSTYNFLSTNLFNSCENEDFFMEIFDFVKNKILDIEEVTQLSFSNQEIDAKSESQEETNSNLQAKSPVPEEILLEINESHDISEGSEKIRD